MGKIINIKIESILSKNKGYQAVFKISDILNGKKEDTSGLPEDLNLNDLTYFKNCVITSVDVEHSFLMYNNLFTFNRRSKNL
jgi:hypothetical protein